MNLNELNVKQALNGLKNREFTSKDLVLACNSQIDKYDGVLKAFLTRPTLEKLVEAANIADRLIDAEGDSAFEKYPLLGIPCAIKANFNTLGDPTSASSKVLENYISPYESTVTERLKAAGVIIIGKTNMDAFAHGSSTETSDFFKTTNPWDTSRVPGGSSGGSAVAVSADMCTFAIGSETAGSIRVPASWCGVSGFKPTYGRVSRYGVVAMASSTDSPGPIAKNIEDCAYILEIIAGQDNKDATSSSEKVQRYTNNDLKSLNGIKIGRPKSYFDIELAHEVKKRVENFVNELQELGAEIIDMDLMDPKYSIAVYTILQRAEVSSNLARMSGIRYGNTRGYFGKEAKKRMMLGAYVLSAGYYDAFYSKAQRVRTLIVNDFNEAFTKVDLIVAPTLPVVAMKLGESDKYPAFGEIIDQLQEPSSIAGLTAASVPCGLAYDLPVGAQLIGPQFSEKLLANVLMHFQENTDYHNMKPNLAITKGEC